MYDAHLFLDDEKFNSNETELIDNDRMTSFLYESFYRDLVVLGEEKFLKSRAKLLSKEGKIKALTRAIDYFSQSHIEEYEKCAFMKNLLNKLVNKQNKKNEKN
jgi:hypothetical protein